MICGICACVYGNKDDDALGYCGCEEPEDFYSNR